MGSRLICYLSATVFLVTVSWVSNAADDCAAAYLDFMEHTGDRASTISPEQLARSHRSALRIYYACATQTRGQVYLASRDFALRSATTFCRRSLCAIASAVGFPPASSWRTACSCFRTSSSACASSKLRAVVASGTCPISRTKQSN
jgi:hypothetical protein